jgi:hypothetical protein
MAKTAALVGRRLRLPVAAGRAQRAAEHRRVCREIVETVLRLEPVTVDAQIGGDGLKVAVQHGVVGDVLAADVTGELVQTLARLERERPRFLVAVEHRQDARTAKHMNGVGPFRNELVEFPQHLVRRFRT